MAVETSRSGLAPDLPNPEAGAAASHDGDSPAAAFAEVGRNFAELRSYVSYYVSAKLDGIKLSVRKIAIYAAMGIVGGLAAGALVVTAVALLCIGLAGAVSAIFDVSWLGPLLVGLLVLLGIAGGVYFGLTWLLKAARTQMVHKYEQLRNQQRAEFGHDVHDRAAESA